MKKKLHFAIGLVLAALFYVWKHLLRFKNHNDPRTDLEKQGKPYVIAMLHAHLPSGILSCDRKYTTMVSRSADGEIAIPILKLQGCRAIRGSSRKKDIDKGGMAALEKMQQALTVERPGVLTIDGPRGPRNFPHRGVAKLALETGITIVPVILVPTKRWILTKTWDRMQLPKPFTDINIYWCNAIYPTDNKSENELRIKIGEILQKMEKLHDIDEFSKSQICL